jgi:NIMA (never in mitosis gene a)-related kinase
MSEREKTNALAEVRYLASVQHPNVVAFKAAFIDEPSSTLNLVMEYANCGDLSQRVKRMRDRDQMFQEDVIMKILVQMALGINALHQLRIMHRDLKAANIFLTDNNIVKVGDLNVSKIARQDGLNYTQAGTPYYASPEVWKDKPYDFKSDVWAIGCITYEITALTLPF